MGFFLPLLCGLTSKVSPLPVNRADVEECMRMITREWAVRVCTYTCTGVCSTAVQVDKGSRTRGEGVQNISVWFRCWSEAGDGHYSPFDVIISWICALHSGQALRHYLPRQSTGLSTQKAYGTYSTQTLRTPVFDLCIYNYFSLLYLSVCVHTVCVSYVTLNYSLFTNCIFVLYNHQAWTIQSEGGVADKQTRYCLGHRPCELPLRTFHQLFVPKTPMIWLVWFHYTMLTR